MDLCADVLMSLVSMILTEKQYCHDISIVHEECGLKKSHLPQDYAHSSLTCLTYSQAHCLQISRSQAQCLQIKTIAATRT